MSVAFIRNFIANRLRGSGSITNVFVELIAKASAVVPQGLDAVCGDSVQRYFGLCRRYEAAYRVQGISSKNIESIVRVYTSHPKVLDSRLNSTLIQSLGPSVESLKGLCHCHACTFPAVHPGYTHFRDTLTFYILGKH